MSRLVLSLGVVVTLAPAAVAQPKPVTPQELDAAIKKAADYLRNTYKASPPQEHPSYGLGGPALAGLAMLEAEVPAEDPGVQAVAKAVRARAITEHRTYQLATFLLFLDRLKDPADVPLIQLVAVRLLAGQSPTGGWAYDSVPAVSEADGKRLASGLKSPNPNPGQMHPEVAAYWKSLPANKMGGDDNSNTQFGILAIWIARRHGVPVNHALVLIEQRFRNTQNPSTGGWPYSGQGGHGSPSMICVGLLGLATALARREMVAVKPAAPPPPAAKAPASKYGPTPTDPFFDPPPRADKKKAPPPPPKPEAGTTDAAVRVALTALGNYLATEVRAHGGVFKVSEDGGHGFRDLYFLWSMERVGVVYGLEKIGGVDWYEAGVHGIVRTQSANGSWTVSGYGEDACTAMALLFLCKSNVVRDLTSSVQKKKGPDPNAPPPDDFGTGASPSADPKAVALATELLDTPAMDLARALAKVRDWAGAEHTRALLIAVGKLDGDRRRQVREALAERMSKMTAGTLRGMLQAEDPELRRAAALACAMKGDRAHVNDLIDRLLDDEEFVWRAARAGLQSLTGQDHGPENGATKEQRKAAADKWRTAARTGK